ncbi:MAG: hypothetical protein WC313_08800 [Candidatus Kapaibacterium sp.]|jgi:hypothetical protein|nr:hypothetical protein [Candidatus Kapabacteria bacterium]
MKLKILLICGAVLFSIVFANLQEAQAQRVIKNYNEAITANPLVLAFGLLNVNYERQVSAENSMVIGLTYLGYQGWTGINITGMYKWYLLQDQEKAIKGFGFGPTLQVGYIGYRDDSYSSRAVVAIGGEASYKWIIDDFVLEPVFGLNYNVTVDSGMDWRPFYLGVNVGYAW